MQLIQNSPTINETSAAPAVLGVVIDMDRFRQPGPTDVSSLWVCHRCTMVNKRPATACKACRAIYVEQPGVMAGQMHTVDLSFGCQVNS